MPSKCPTPSEMFDIVISNSIVHHIAEPLVVCSERYALRGPVGCCSSAICCVPMTNSSWTMLVETYAGEESEHAQQLFRDSLHAALNLAEIREMVTQLGYAPETVQATSDRHWTWIARRPE